MYLIFSGHHPDRFFLQFPPYFDYDKVSDKKVFAGLLDDFLGTCYC